MKIKTPILIVIIVVIILIVLAIIFSGWKKEEKGAPEGESPLKNVNIAKEIYGFSAILKEIKDNTLSLDAWIPLAQETEGLVKATLTAIVNDDTEIFELEFSKKQPKDLEEPVYPKKTKMELGDLKPEDKIDVGAISNISDSIKNNAEITLKYIFLIKK